MNKPARHSLAFLGSLLTLCLTAVIPLTAFEAHVINVTATISANPCEEVEIQAMTYWKDHPELWILPQTLGADSIDTQAKAKKVFDSYILTVRDRLRTQLLTLKFNVAYFHVGNALVAHETGTINQLIIDADTLLKKKPAASLTELQRMRNRIANTNEAGKCLICQPE